ncbi:muramidase family protein [Eisenibacter elegans]|uniref:muramidase family protein n=1 Tax=Eisenibacter elegans TaxID=997 RepID=UPI000400DAEB|nr:LysM peptidoglycan-binding domain-containing protein [Eisenibacter elegans]
MKSLKSSISLWLLGFLISLPTLAEPTDSLRLKRIGERIFIVHQVDRGESLSKIAQRYRVQMNQILEYNRHIPTANDLKANDILMVPYGEGQVLTSGSQAPDETQFYNLTHKVVKGDNLTQIARQYSLSLAELREMNNLEDDKIRLGQELIVGVGNRKTVRKNTPDKQYVSANATTPNRVLKSSMHDDNERPIIHTVVRGDNLTQIARQYKVSIDDLKAFNHLTNENVQVGQRLIVGYSDGQAIPNNLAEQTTNYTVVKGDNLTQIARKYNMSVAQLREWNNIDAETIRVGQVLIVAQPIAEGEVAQTQQYQVQKHKVARGESLEGIAKKYQVAIDDIKDWNKLTSSALREGQELVVYLENKQGSVQAQQITQNKQTSSDTPIDAIISMPTDAGNNNASQGNKQGAAANNNSSGFFDGLEGPNRGETAQTTNAAVKKIVYKVQGGDNVYRIAKAFKVQQADVQKWNNLAPNTVLKLNQEIDVFTTVTLAEGEAYLAQMRSGQQNNTNTNPNNNVDTGDGILDFFNSTQGATRGATNNNTQQQAVQQQATQQSQVLKSSQYNDPIQQVAQQNNAATTQNNTAANTQANVANTQAAAATTQQKTEVKVETQAIKQPVQEELEPTVSTVVVHGKIEREESGYANIIQETGDNNKYVALHRDANVGQVIRLSNPENNLTAFVRIIGQLPENEDDKVIIRVSKSVVDALKPSSTDNFKVTLHYTVQ